MDETSLTATQSIIRAQRDAMRGYVEISYDKDARKHGVAVEASDIDIVGKRTTIYGSWYNGKLHVYLVEREAHK